MRATIVGARVALVSAGSAGALTATPTPGSATCVGDCDDSGTVGVSAVIRCVGLAVGAGGGECVRCDADGDGLVSINEIIVAVNALLTGCGGRDPYEPDNSLSQASPIYCGELQRHDLSVSGDDDWVRIDLPPHIGGSIVTEPVDDRYWDTTLALYSATGAQLAYNDEADDADELSRIDFGCPAPAVASTYFARASQYGGDPLGPYGLRLTCASCKTPRATPTVPPIVVDDLFEPDDVVEQAVPIGCGEIQRHSADARDVDWLSLSLASRSTVHVRVLTGGPNYLESLVYDADGAELPMSYEGEFECGRNSLPAGEYHLRVAPVFPVATAAYDIAVFCEPCALANGSPTPTWTPSPTPTAAAIDPSEPDSRASAAPIGCGEGVIRSLAPRGDSDWFALQVPGRQAVRILTYALPSDVQLALQNSEGVDIGFGSGFIERRCGEAALDSGTYFIESYGSPFSPAFGYDLWVSCEPCAAPGPSTPVVATRTPTPLPLPTDAYEPDDSPAQARPIACGELQMHSLHSRFDEDWAEFEVSAPSALSIAVAGDYYVELLDAVDGQFVASGYGVLGVNCEQSRLHSGRYLIHGPQSANPIASYNLSLACAGCAVTPTATPTPSPSATRTRYPTRTPGGPEETLRRFAIDPGTRLAEAAELGSGLFTTALSGASTSNGPVDGVGGGPLPLLLGLANDEGIAPLRLAEDVTLRIGLVDGYLCLQLLAANSDGRIDCDGGTAFNILASQAAGDVGFAFNVSTGLGTPVGAGHGDLLIQTRYRRVSAGDADFGDSCTDIAYLNPVQALGFTTAGAKASKGGRTLKADGAPFDCADFATPCSGGAWVAPIPETVSGGAVAQVLRFAEAGAGCLRDFPN
jgi:hypothetical protein